MALDIISFINLDMKAPNAEIVYGNQYDSTGHVNAQLLNDGTKWEVPSGARAVISYRKSDNIGGYYDTTDFGETAVSVSSDRSIITVALDAQTMTTFGPVYMQINFLQSGQRLSTFEFLLQVKKSPIVQSNIESKWFVHLLSISGLTVDDTLSILGEAADAKTVGDALTGVRTDIVAERLRAQTSESDLNNLKINKPASEGTSGQLLRTLGNGLTEWTDYGLPSDEQTEIAISSWLDNHPEAVTTVEDYSLNSKKLIMNALGYVIPEMFGAVGDGATDDSVAFQECLNSGFDVYIPRKNYNIGQYIYGRNCLVKDDNGTYVNLKPFYKRPFKLDFNKIYKYCDFQYPNASCYDDAMTYDTAINKLVIAFYNYLPQDVGTVLGVLNLSTMSIESAYTYPISIANGLSYNPYTNKIFLSCYDNNPGTHVIDGTTFEYEGLFDYPDDIIDIDETTYYVYYDPITHTYAIVPHKTTSPYSIRIYDDNLVLLHSIDIDMGESLVMQDNDYYDGKFYKISWQCVLEIDVLTGEYRRINTKGYYEIEGITHDNKNLFIVGHPGTSGGLPSIYSDINHPITNDNLNKIVSTYEILENFDLNSILSDGEYYVEISDTEHIENYHTPNSITNGIVLVKGIGTSFVDVRGAVQIFLSGSTAVDSAYNYNNHVFIRNFNESIRSWSAWRVIDSTLYNVPTKFNGTINSEFCHSGNVYGYKFGNSIWISGWIRLKEGITITKDDRLVNDVPVPVDNVNLLYYDQNANDVNALYIPIRQSYIRMNEENLGSRLGHYLNLSGAYFSI